MSLSYTVDPPPQTREDLVEAIKAFERVQHSRNPNANLWISHGTIPPSTHAEWNQWCNILDPKSDQPFYMAGILFGPGDEFVLYGEYR